MFDTSKRITRRRSSAGPVPPVRPQRPREGFNAPRSGGLRPTFLALRDHGKVYVADLPRLSDGQLAHVAKEAQEVLESLRRRLEELEGRAFLTEMEQDTRIRASTKRDVTERFISAIQEEQELRRSNPALRAAAGESLARAFLEVARHRLPGATFDSLLQEALAACGPGEAQDDPEPRSRAGAEGQPTQLRRLEGGMEERPPALPVVLTPAPVTLPAAL